MSRGKESLKALREENARLRARVTELECAESVHRAKREDDEILKGDGYGPIVQTLRAAVSKAREVNLDTSSGLNARLSAADFAALAREVRLPDARGFVTIPQQIDLFLDGVVVRVREAKTHG